MICVESLFSFGDISHFINVDLGLPVSDHSNNSLNMTWKNTNQDFSKTVLQNILKFCTLTALICRYNIMAKLPMVFTFCPTQYTGRHRGWQTCVFKVEVGYLGDGARCDETDIRRKLLGRTEMKDISFRQMGKCDSFFFWNFLMFAWYKFLFKRKKMTCSTHLFDLFWTIVHIFLKMVLFFGWKFNLFGTQ
jgi:hypothetical protein